MPQLTTKRSEIDRILIALAHPIRRDILDVLQGEQDELQVETLAAGYEQRSARRNIQISLRHKHLPKLDDTNIVEYDRNDGTIRYTGNSEFEHLLERVNELA